MERCHCAGIKSKQVHGPRVHLDGAALLARVGQNAQMALSVVCSDGAAAGQRWCRAPVFSWSVGRDSPDLRYGNFSVSGFCPLAPWALLRNGGLPVIPLARCLGGSRLAGCGGDARQCAARRCAALPPEVEAALARAKLRANP